MKCPNCNSSNTGRVASNQYYCRECCVEFLQAKGGLHVYAVDPEGELQPVALAMESSHVSPT